MGLAATTGLSRLLPRERAILFVNTAIAAIVSLQILDLGLNQPALKLTLIPIVLGGFAFSYFLEERFHRLVIVLVDLLAALAAIHYFRLIVRNPDAMGNSLGVLLGVLMTLLAFAAFSTYRHRLIITAGVVFVFFSAATSYDLMIVVLFPVFLVFCAGSLYSARSLDLRQQIEHLGADRRLHTGAPAAFGFALASLIIRVVAVVLVLSVLIYVLIPHYTDVNRSSFLLPRSGTITDTLEDLQRRNRQERVQLEEGALNITGFATEFDLSGNSSIFGPRSLFESKDTAVTMKSAQNGYLRGVVFDRYTGRAWVQSAEARRVSYKPAGHSRTFPYYNSYPLPVVDFPSRELHNSLLKPRNIAVVPENSFSPDPTPRPKYGFVTQEIAFAKDHPPVFFSFYQPIRLESLSVVRRGMGDVANPDPRLDAFSVPHSALPRHPEGFKYIVTALRPIIRRRDMGQSPPRYPPNIVQQYTQLPTPENAAELELIVGTEVVPVSERVRNLARTVVAGAETPYEKVTRIYDFLTESFEYTLECPPLNKGEEATRAFLFRTQEGFCQQFASAMAVMARVNGIPARVVAGYAPGRFSFIANRYVYRDSNAHSWVEIYFDGLGWVPFDPTPSSGDLFNLGGIKLTIESSIDFLEDLFIIDPQGARETIASFLQGVYGYTSTVMAVRWYLVPLVLVVLVAALSLIFWLKRRRRIHPGLVPENEVVSCFLELQQLLKEAALPREPWETGGDYLRRVAQTLKQQSEALQRFLVLYYHSAFSARPPTKEEVQSARQFLGDLKAYLQEQPTEPIT